ncbi:hypothetical protein B6S12_05925, partial [Helicobacter valdiviensis]
MSIKRKQIILVAFLMLASLCFTVELVVKYYNEYKNMKLVPNKVDNYRILVDLIHNLQIERGLSVGFLTLNNDDNWQNVINARNKSDAILKQYENYLSDIQGNYQKNVLNDNLKKILALRKQVELLEAKDYALKMTKVIKSFMNLSVGEGFAISTLSNSQDIYDYVLASYYLVNMREATGLLRANINAAFLSAKPSDNLQIKSVFENLGIFNTYLYQFGIILDKYEGEAKIKQIMEENQNKFQTLNSKYIDIYVKNFTTGTYGANAYSWFKESTDYINTLKVYGDYFLKRTHEEALKDLQEIESEMIFTLILSLFFIVVGIILSFLIVKNLIQSLNSIQSTLGGFFSYLNHESKNAPKPINVKSNDEFG